MAGRPTKYTPDRVKAILTALEAGMGRVGAVQYGGISYETFTNWTERKVGFLEQVQEAESKCELWMVGNIKKAASSDWHAALAWLERRRPQEWGKQDSIDILELVRQMARQQGYTDDETQEAVAEAERHIAELRRGSRS